VPWCVRKIRLHHNSRREAQGGLQIKPLNPQLPPRSAAEPFLSGSQQCRFQRLPDRRRPGDASAPSAGPGLWYVARKSITTGGIGAGSELGCPADSGPSRPEDSELWKVGSARRRPKGEVRHS